MESPADTSALWVALCDSGLMPKPHINPPPPKKKPICHKKVRMRAKIGATAALQMTESRAGFSYCGSFFVPSFEGSRLTLLSAIQGYSPKIFRRAENGFPLHRLPGCLDSALSRNFVSKTS